MTQDQAASLRQAENKMYYINPKDTFVRSDIRNKDRRTLQKEDVQDLIDSFRERIHRGLPPVRMPLEAVRDERGRVIIVAGRRRRKAAIFVGIQEIPVIFADDTRKLSEEEELEHEISENILRKSVEPLQEARAVVQLICFKAKNIPFYKRLIEAAPEGTSESQVLISYMKRMQSSLKNNAQLWEAEAIRNPLFRIVLDIMKRLGKSWYTYTERVLSLLSYPEPIQELFNSRLINYTSATKLKKIKDPEILSNACARLAKKRKESRSISEKAALSAAINEAMAESKDLKRVSSIIKITERVDRDFNKITPRRDKSGWFYNSSNVFGLRESSWRDIYNGSLWVTAEYSNDMSVPRTVYERIIQNYTTVADKVLIIGATTPEPLRIALENGCYSKHVAPESMSEYTYAYPLDDLTASGYTLLNRRNPDDEESISDAGIEDLEADLGILVLHPYGEINVANELNWIWPNRVLEPTDQLFSKDYLAKCGSIIAHSLTKCKKIVVISRVSEYSEGKKLGKKIMDTPGHVSAALSGFVEAVHYFKTRHGGKLWTVHVAKLR